MSAKKRMKLALFWGASDLNLSNTPLNVDIVASNTFNGIFDFLGLLFALNNGLLVPLFA